MTGRDFATRISHAKGFAGKTWKVARGYLKDGVEVFVLEGRSLRQRKVAQIAQRLAAVLPGGRGQVEETVAQMQPTQGGQRAQLDAQQPERVAAEHLMVAGQTQRLQAIHARKTLHKTSSIHAQTWANRCHLALTKLA